MPRKLSQKTLSFCSLLNSCYSLMHNLCSGILLHPYSLLNLLYIKSSVFLCFISCFDSTHMPVASWKKVGIEFVLFFHTCIYEKCFILLSCLIDNLAAFTIIVLKPFTLRILRESLYHLPVLNVVAKKFNAFMFLDAFYVIWFIYFLGIFCIFFFPLAFWICMLMCFG